MTQEALRSADKSIAVIGLGCRLPGANTPRQFWEFLCRGGNAIADMPPDRPYYRQPGEFGRLTTHRGGYIDHWQDFDPYFFGISPREAAGLDPQQRFLFETAWRASEDAGVTAEQLQRRRTGVFVGLCADDYHELALEQSPGMDPQAVLGGLRSNGSGRLSMALRLRGPSVTIDTACSSSLVCVHLAARSIQAGDCELAFAGGANFMLHPSIARTYRRAGLLSAEAQCRAFAENADGFVRSEGAGMVLLKPLHLALADNDRIYAVIRGSAVNNDGGSAPFMMPSRHGQIEVIRAACADAGISPADLTYVEAHGTGTRTGDPIEVGALAEAMAVARPVTSPLRIGSCKTNLGHLEGAAGIAGFIKTALCVYHRAIPPSLHANQLNSAIAWDQIPIVVQQQLAPWPGEQPWLAGVSSFGITGTNAHVVLEGVSGRPAEAGTKRATRLLPISARDESSLREMAELWNHHLRTSAAGLADICHTASVRQTQFAHRLVVAGDSPAQMAASLTAWLAGTQSDAACSGRVASGDARQPVFVFSGVGSQRPHMALELYDRQPAFRESLLRAQEAVASITRWNVLDELRRDPADSQLDRVEIMQPVLFAVQVALAGLWKWWGVEPSVVVGHSLGEIAAAHTAGVLSLEDAALIVTARSQLMATTGDRGGMLACGVSAEEGAALIRGYEDRVAVGVVNGRRSIVLSGERGILDEIGGKLAASDIFCRSVRTPVANHSPLMNPILEEFAERIAGILPGHERYPLYSAVSGHRVAGADLTPSYWVRNLRDTVLFAPALERILEQGERVFLEISPHPLLTAPMQHTAGDRFGACAFIPSMRRGNDSEAVMLEAFGRLHTLGCRVNWTAHSEAGARHVDVPQQPFRRERVWMERETSTAPAEQAYARTARPGAHPLLPLRFDPAATPGTHIWEGALDPKDHPFLLQHGVQGQPVLPAAVYYELAYSIAVEILGPGPKLLSEIRLPRAIFLGGGQTVRLQAVLDAAAPNASRLRFFSSPAAADGWELCCELRLREAAEAFPPPLAPVERSRFHAPVTSAEFYSLTKSFGFDYGDLYQAIGQASLQGQEAIAEMRLPQALAKETGFGLHPAFLDAVVQLPLLPMSHAWAEPKPLVPVSAKEVYFARPLNGAESVWSHCRTDGPLQYDATLLAEDGSVIVAVRGALCRELIGVTARSARPKWADWTYKREWEKVSPAEFENAPGRWLLFAESYDAAAAGRELERYGQEWSHAPLSSAAEGALNRFAGALGPARGIVFIAPAGGSGPDAAYLQKVCGSFLDLLQSCSRLGAAKVGRILVATRGAQSVTGSDRTDLALGPLLGMARAAANEFPALHVTLVDLDAAGSGFDGLIAEALATSAELEVAYRETGRYAARLARLDVEALPRRRARIRLEAQRDASYRVVSSQPGSLEHIGLERSVRRAPGPGEVEVRVDAAGLNFLDVLRSLHLAPDQQPGAASFGMELAGRVTRIGEGVTGMAEGDLVMALGNFSEGCLQAYATIPARRAFRAPEGFTAEQSAGCLIAYQTAWYALMELGRMRAGECVLIHAAAGGVGLAAIEVARHIGARIFATAGAPAKREYLTSLGIEHVMDSRTLAFAEQVLEATGGRGVDLVLNSIAGDAIPKSLSALAMGGRFLEIGKRDIYGHTALDLFPFRKNLSFYAIDMLGLMAENEEMVLRITSKIVELLRRGELPPLPVTAFPASRARDGFEHMAQSRQIGKVVITFDEAEVNAAIPAGQLVQCNATYLITGGQTGIGLECAKWLAVRGARHLVLTGRREPTALEEEAIAGIRDAGIDVWAVKQDVSDRSGLRALLRKIDLSMPPLAGVIHSAGIARDGILQHLTWPQFAEVFAPKVAGAWNLHLELGGRDLEFFVLFSSVASLLGSAGQANYAAANAFLDSLAESRTRNGQPVLAVNWGPWTGLGMLQRHHLQPSPIFGAEGIRPQDGIACLEALLSAECSQAAAMSADWDIWRQSMAATSRSLLSNILGGAGGSDGPAPQHPADRLGADLAGLPEAEAVALIEARIKREVIRVLRLSENRFDPQTDLQRYGLDSLMAVELSNRIQEALAVEMPVMTLLKGCSLRDLAGSLYARLRSRRQPDSLPPVAAASEPLTLVRNAARPFKLRSDTWMIREGGPEPPLFCLGGVWEWGYIANHLAAERSVIGLVALPSTTGRPRIQDFAASVVEAVRAQLPDGPFQLCGWSVSGLVAFEAAQQLRDAGLPVHSLVIVDTFLPLASRPLSGAGRLAAWARLERKRFSYHIDKIRHDESRVTAGYVKDRIGNLVRQRIRPVVAAKFGSSRASQPVHSARRLDEAVLAASMTYQAKPYDGRVLLCVAADRPPGPEWDYATAWQQVLTGATETFVAPGDHVTMLDSENADGLAERIRQHLN